MTTITKDTREILAFLLFEIWKERCSRMFFDKQRPHNILSEMVIQAVKHYRENIKKDMDKDMGLTSNSNQLFVDVVITLTTTKHIASYFML
jgi:hypothetical protein